MKTLRKILLILLVLVIALGLLSVVRAAEGDSYSLKLSSDKKEISAGETVNVTLTLDNVNIQSGEKGLGSYQGKISYDKDVFELVSVKGAANWDTPSENNGIITAARSDGKTVSGTQQIATVSLKAKANAKVGQTVAKVTNFEASNAVENIATSDASTSIQVNASASQDTGSTTNGGSASNSSSSNSTKSNATKSKEATGTLPKTGVSNAVLGGIAVVAILGVGAYIGYKKTIIK